MLPPQIVTHLRSISLRVCHIAFALALLAGQLGGFSAATARAQSNCDDLAQQVASQQSELANDQADAQSLLNQVGPLTAAAPAELLAAASQGALPGITPDTAASFGATVVQIGVEIAAWQSQHSQGDATTYLGDLLSQLGTWEGQYGTLAPVQALVPSLVQLSAVFAQLDQAAGKAQGDLALLDSFNQQLQDCQSGGGPAPEPTPPPDEAPPDDGSALCSVGGATGASASQCFTLESDAAYAVWEACTEQYFAAVSEAFRTGGDVPANTCDPAWDAALAAIQQRWGAPQP